MEWPSVRSHRSIASLPDVLVSSMRRALSTASVRPSLDTAIQVRWACSPQNSAGSVRRSISALVLTSRMTALSSDSRPSANPPPPSKRATGSGNLRDPISRPVMQSIKQTDPSPVATIRLVPPVAKPPKATTLVTLNRSRLVGRFQILSTPSVLREARLWPSGEKATVRTWRA